ncbi:glycoside hydrolase family 16 protein [Nocardioides currus]|uniref:glycoside hydrolase family 16 protein n=1 Tax=Nocardioides currus TaxID=2133958 RepID=UPI001056F32C|nr:glycoside hydrolase family 16 protein [Nocardioides currus]
MVEDEGPTDDKGEVRLVSPEAAYSRIVTLIDGARSVTELNPTLAGPALWLSEEFDDGLVSELWLKVDQPDEGPTCSTSDQDQVVEADGVMTLTVEEDPDRMCRTTGLPARLNGHLIYRGQLGYGTTAARIRFPRNRDVTGQFWLQPGDPGLPWLIDDNHEGVLIGGTAGTEAHPRFDTDVHTSVDGVIRSSRRVVPTDLGVNDGQFHVYAVRWMPDGYTFLIDGNEVRTVKAATILPPMTVGLAMLAPRRALPTDAADRAMDVDWFRVWAPS